MTQHTFKLGERVTLAPSFARKGGGVFRVTRLLPAARDDLVPQYRIKSETEQHERVALEDEIRPEGSAPMASDRSAATAAAAFR